MAEHAASKQAGTSKAAEGQQDGDKIAGANTPIGPVKSTPVVAVAPQNQSNQSMSAATLLDVTNSSTLAGLGTSSNSQ